MAWSMKGGIFSLLWSPSSRVVVVFARFGFGVESGVGRVMMFWESHESDCSDASTCAIWWDLLPRTDPPFSRAVFILS